MASSFGALKHTSINIQSQGDLLSLPPSTALQFYRICQETALYIITHSNANQLDIRLTASQQEVQLTIKHNGGTLAERLQPTNEAKLIDYRLKMINGSRTSEPMGGGAESFLFHAPLAGVPV